jgi:hypothetical protein
MKTTAYRIILPVMLLVIAVIAQAQENDFNRIYISVSGGPAYGTVSGIDARGYKADVTGSAYGLDVQVGAAVKKNWILHGTGGIKSIRNPEFTGTDVYSVMENFNEYFLGMGTTYYLGRNYFITGNVGTGYFTLINPTENTSYESDIGLSYQFKAGHEWRIASSVGLGVAVEYGGTKVTTTYADGSLESWNSRRYGLRFSLTFNSMKRQ